MCKRNEHKDFVTRLLDDLLHHVQPVADIKLNYLMGVCVHRPTRDLQQLAHLHGGVDCGDLLPSGLDEHLLSQNVVKLLLLCAERCVPVYKGNRR